MDAWIDREQYTYNNYNNNINKSKEKKNSTENIIIIKI